MGKIIFVSYESKKKQNTRGDRRQGGTGEHNNVSKLNPIILIKFNI